MDMRTGEIMPLSEVDRRVKEKADKVLVDLESRLRSRYTELSPSEAEKLIHLNRHDRLAELHRIRFGRAAIEKAMKEGAEKKE